MEVSTNLLDWSALATAVTTNSLTPISDPQATLHPRRFYRTREVPPGNP